MKFDPRNNKFTSIFTREMLEATLPSVLLICLALFFAYKFIDPAPPRKIVIATGEADLNYNAYAAIYGVYLQKEGITLELRKTSGDTENLRLLKDPESDVDIAFIQDGVAHSEGAGSLLSLGSLYYQPVWIFCRCKATTTHLSALKGKRIAIGYAGNGTHTLVSTLLTESGINNSNTKLVSIGGEEAATALRQGKLDAALFVDVANSGMIHEMVTDKRLRLLSMDTAEAFSRKFAFMHHLVLPEGAMDLARNIPGHDVHLVAPTATLVVKESMHPALAYLMMKVIAEVHGGPSLFNTKGEFPSAKDTDFPLSTQALNFYKSGLPIIDKYLPFWAATFVNRTLIVILPLLALLIPLTKIIPMVYVWLVKRKLFRYYGELRFLDTQLQEIKSAADVEECLEKLNEIEAKVVNVKLPVPFSQYAYELRAHIELVRSKLNHHKFQPASV
ncbi:MULTISPECIES: TAXI family TRAP transporter solute-binding subunit [unclassified Methylophilus]|uniref:TAXI family TRAP transporter solute-binding subunit n=1 Tax=unclassified Methylophilus TaxID=2630143 RepID=UPI0003673F77|nr:MULTISPECIES: TAXI family TRAP transporter solute-binding subunit [unclassified Methylophilus]